MSFEKIHNFRDLGGIETKVSWMSPRWCECFMLLLQAPLTLTNDPVSTSDLSRSTLSSHLLYSSPFTLVIFPSPLRHHMIHVVGLP